MRDFSFENKGTKLYCTVWDDVPSPKGLVLLVHNMGDYCKRYQDFVDFLAANSYMVVAPDLRGHGRTCNGYDHRGEGDSDCFDHSVDDLYKLACYAISTYRLPLLMLGIGYGSFLTQSFIQRHGDMLCGAALLGTAQISGFRAFIGDTIVSTIAGFVDAKTPGTLLSNKICNAYDKRFADEKTRFAWLSRDKDEVRAYVGDPFCGAQFFLSLGFQQSFFRAVGRLYTRKRLSRIPTDLPIWLAGGTKDPVGDNGRRVRHLFETYATSGLSDLTMKLYADARHELLFETNRDEVYTDCLAFIDRCFAANRLPDNDTASA